MENIGLEDRGNAQISEILAALVSKGSFGNRTPEVKAETNVIGRVDRAPIVLGGGVHARRHSNGRVEYSAEWTIQYLRDGRIPISRVICVCCTAVKILERVRDIRCRILLFRGLGFCRARRRKYDHRNWWGKF